MNGEETTSHLGNSGELACVLMPPFQWQVLVHIPVNENKEVYMKFMNARGKRCSD